MKLTWYFDFISPFAYLQLQQFSRLPKHIEIEYCPILLAGLLNHWNNVGPAEVPPKRRFTYQHCHWKAKSLGIPFTMPPAHPFNSLKALRLAIALDSKPTAIKAIFNAIWQQGLDLASPQFNDYLVAELGLGQIQDMVADDSVKQQLRANTERAAADQVFGVPSFIAPQNKQLFWGLDAFDMLLDYLDSPADFYDPEMRRIEDLPQGAQRPR